MEAGIFSLYNWLYPAVDFYSELLHYLNGSSSCRLIVGCSCKVMTADAHWIHVCENLYASVYVPFSQFVFIYSHIVIETFTLIHKHLLKYMLSVFAPSF